MFYALIITLFGILNQFGKSCFAFGNKTEEKNETTLWLKESILWTIRNGSINNAVTCTSTLLYPTY